MDKGKKEARRLAKQQQKLAALLGLDAPAPGAVVSPQQFSEELSREAEATLAYYDDPSMFERKECGECSGAFRVNRANVNYCSDSCRRASLEKIGITWDTTKRPADRWKMNWQAKKVYEPLVVPGNVADFIDSQREEAPVETVPDSPTGDTCGEEHTYEQGCEFYFLDSVV